MPSAVSSPRPAPPARASLPSSPSRIHAPIASAATRDQHAGRPGRPRRRAPPPRRTCAPRSSRSRAPPSPARPSSPRCCAARAGSRPATRPGHRRPARPPTAAGRARSRSRAGREGRSPGRSVARARRTRAGGPRRAPAHPHGTAQPRPDARVECTLPGRRHVLPSVTTRPDRGLAQPPRRRLAPARCSGVPISVDRLRPARSR